MMEFDVSELILLIMFYRKYIKIVIKIFWTTIPVFGIIIVFPSYPTVNLRSASQPPSAEQTRLAPFPSMIRLVSLVSSSIPKDEFPQVSASKEQRTTTRTQRKQSKL